MHGGLLPVSECPETLDLWRVGSRERSRGGRERLYTMLNIHILTYRAYCSFLFFSLLFFLSLSFLSFFSPILISMGAPFFFPCFWLTSPDTYTRVYTKHCIFRHFFASPNYFTVAIMKRFVFPGYVTGKTTWPLLNREIVTLRDVRISPDHSSWMKRRKYVLILGWECGTPQGTINFGGMRWFGSVIHNSNCCE